MARFARQPAACESGATRNSVPDSNGLPDRLRAEGFELTDPLKNSWLDEQYKGIYSRWREPGSGQVFELQFHTRASFEAKQLTHPAYERIRNPETSDDQRAELEDFQRRVGQKIPIPPGAADIEDHPWEKRDG